MVFSPAPELLSFQDAVAHVRAAADRRVAAYAALPFAPRGRPIGTTIWAITFDDFDLDEGDDPLWIQVVSGARNSEMLEEGGYGIDQVPAEARALRYATTTAFDISVFGSYDPEITLRTLQGEDIGALLDAMDDEGTALRPLVSSRGLGMLENDHPDGDDAELTTEIPATPRMLAEFLLSTAVPMTWLPSRGGHGHAPVLIALLDRDDPRGDPLRDIFGGFLLDRTGPDFTKTGADIYWVTYGFGAAKAAHLVGVVLPASATLRQAPPVMREAWGTWVEFAEVAVGTPADASGKRPQAVFQQLRRLATRLDRELARALEFAHDLRTVVVRALEQEHRAGKTAAALELPTAGSLAHLVAPATLDATLESIDRMPGAYPPRESTEETLRADA